MCNPARRALQDPRTVYTNYPGNYTSIAPMNIRITFVGSGELWRFDFPTLVLSILSVIVLFGAVNTIVTWFAEYCMCDPVLKANFLANTIKEVHLSHNRTGVSFTDDSNMAEMANGGIRGRAPSNLSTAAMI